MKFEHKGIEIEVHPSGVFWATVNSERVNKPSLEAMKKHIDKALKNSFTPFVALTDRKIGGWGESSNSREIEKYGFSKIEVVGLIKSKDRWNRGETLFVCIIDKHKDSLSSVIADTPENRDAVRRAREYREETLRIERLRKEEQGRLDNAITRILAKDYANK